MLTMKSRKPQRRNQEKNLRKRNLLIPVNIGSGYNQTNGDERKIKKSIS